jgi:DNA-binding HxlR family transcriptional regulator
VSDIGRIFICLHIAISCELSKPILLCKQKDHELLDAHRSGCPINLTLELLGDRWSLIVIRDIMFGNRRRYRELLTQSEEGIASNVLADRLKRLVANGLLSKADDPRHKQSVIYSLTEPAIQLVPLLANMGAWGRRHAPVSKELSIRAQLLEQGGAKMWDELMTELRAYHLGTAAPAASVLEELKRAYEATVQEQMDRSPVGFDIS